MYIKKHEVEELKVKKEQKLLEDYLNEGNELAKNKSYAEAIEKYKEAINIYPNYSQARFNLGVVYKKNNEFAEAINAFKEFIAMDPFNVMVAPAKKGVIELTKELEKAEAEKVEKDSTINSTDDKDTNGKDS